MVTQPKMSSQTITTRAVIFLGLLFVASWLIVLQGAGVVPKVATLYPLAVPANPYFQYTEAFLLYVLMPLVVMSSLVLLLSPGVLLVLGLGAARCWSELIILAFGMSFLVHVLLASAVKLVLGISLSSAIFLSTAVGGGAVGWAILAFRVSQGTKLPWPISERSDVRRLCWTIAIPLIALWALLPVLFWQDFSADGFGVLESGRSLSVHFLPRWPTDSGLLGLGIGMIPMAYPVHWFVMLFGLIEAAARLPLILYLPVLFCILVRLIEWCSPRVLGFAEEAVLFLALAVYTVTMSYNASYDAYFADIASPAAFETLTVICMLAAIYFLGRGRDLWFYFFALMSYLCRPTGLLVLGLMGLAIFFCWPENWKPWLIRIGIAISLCAVIALVYEKVYVPSVIADSALGYPSTSILGRFRYLRIDDLIRINYALFPGGILPFIFLFAFSWQDMFGRIITIISLGYFVLFYFQAFIALHQFVPTMVLPLVVFWRIYLHYKGWLRRLILPAAAVAGVFALWLSLPEHFQINRTHRGIGQVTAYLVGNYDVDYQPIKHVNLLLKLIPPDWEVQDPSQELVGSPFSIIYYAAHSMAPDAKVNYVVQQLSEPAPPGFTKIADDRVAALYIKDMQQWNRDRFRHLRTDYKSPLYDIPRTTLFRYWGARYGEYGIDLGAQPVLWRLFGRV